MYIFIVFLFIKNNLRVFTNPKIRCNYRTWKLINQSFFEIKKCNMKEKVAIIDSLGAHGSSHHFYLYGQSKVC